MAMHEQFSLRWNDFHKNLAHSFQALLEGEDLVDVTLAAGGQYVHAHKLILSVCSPYFKELFKMNPCEHPIVILKDVAHHELRQLLQFIYKGEVNVGRHELSAFLHTAELLQIKGLTTNGERSESPIPVIDDPPNSAMNHQFEQEQAQAERTQDDEPVGLEAEPSAGPPPNDEPRSPLKRYEDAQDILLKNTPNKNSCNIRKKLRPVNASPTHAENMSIEYASDGEPVIDIDNDTFQSVLVVPKKEAGAAWTCKTKGVKCPSCHRIFANRYNLKVHVRDKHDTREGTLQCDICQKRMRNPSCLRVHLYHHRKQAAYLAQLGHVGGEQLRQAIQEMVGPNPEWRNENQYCVEYGTDNGPEASSSPRAPQEPSPTQAPESTPTESASRPPEPVPAPASTPTPVPRPAEPVPIPRPEAARALRQAARAQAASETV